MAINKTQNLKGMSLIEILIVISIITIGLVYLLGMFSFSLRIAGSEQKLTRANFMAQEAMEGVRNFRDETTWGENGLDTLNVSTFYHLEKTGSPPKWTLSPDTKTINGFTQKIVVDNVRRDLYDNKLNNIVENGGTLDSDTRKVTVTISWLERGKSKEIELITFFTNWNQ